MAQRLSPPVQTSPLKRTYRVTNWPDYNRALVARGWVTLWLHEEMLRDWRATGGRNALQRHTAILSALSLRAVYKLALRQTQGFLGSLMALPDPATPVPHYSTLSRRAAELAVPALVRGAQKGPLHLAIDAGRPQGLWRGGMEDAPAWQGQTPGVGATLHLAVDTETGEILAHTLTGSDHHDGPELPGLLAKVKEPVAVVSADKGYDSFACHRAILAIGAHPVIPPRTGAAIIPPPGEKDPPATRGDAVRRIHEIGVKPWKVEAGYHRRSLAETAMARYKTIIGPNLKSRSRTTQITEAAVAICCINTFTALGMPITVEIK